MIEDINKGQGWFSKYTCCSSSSVLSTHVGQLTSAWNSRALIPEELTPSSGSHGYPDTHTLT